MTDSTAEARSRRHRSWWRRPLAFVAIGVVVTVVLAWCAAIVPWSRFRATRAFVHIELPTGERLAVVDRLRRWGANAVIVDSEAPIISGRVPWNPNDPLRIAPSAQSFDQIGSDPDGWRAWAVATAPSRPASAWRREAFGFPLPAMEHVWLESGSGSVSVEQGIDLRGSGPGQSRRLVALPFGLNAWAFLVDTICIAGLFWVLGGALGVVRRRRRRKRGVCAQCRYPLDGAARCPECGWLAVGEASDARPSSG